MKQRESSIPASCEKAMWGQENLLSDLMFLSMHVAATFKHLDKIDSIALVPSSRGASDVMNRGIKRNEREHFAPVLLNARHSTVAWNLN